MAMNGYRIVFHDRQYSAAVKAMNDEDAKRLVEDRYPGRDCDLMRGNVVVAKYRRPSR